MMSALTDVPLKDVHPIQVQRTTVPRPRPDGPLGFGRYFTDHIVLAEHDGKEWGAMRIAPNSTSVEVGSGALQYGFSIFEGLKAFRAADGHLNLFRADMHARRFNRSAEMLCMPSFPVDAFVAGCRAIVREDADWYPRAEGGSIYVRPTLYANETFLGVRPANHHGFAILLSPVESYWSGGERPLRLWAERERVRAAPGGLGAAKTGGNYAATVFAAKQAAARGFDQVLWLDAMHHEYLEEVGTMNMFARIDDVVYTPSLGSGTILAGVTRDSCLHILRNWGIKIEERALSITELAAASAQGRDIEMWGTGTAATISPIEEIVWNTGSARAKGFELARRLRTEVQNIQTGRAPDPGGWLTRI